MKQSRKVILERGKPLSGDVVDGEGMRVTPLDDDFGFFKSECERDDDPLSDDYVREEYR